MTDRMIGIYVAKYDQKTGALLHRERIRGHTLESEAAITVASMRRSIDDAAGYRVEVFDEEWDGQTNVGSKKR